MVDLHSHILPELDDGARSMEEALEMARLAAADGIQDIVATPHAFNGIYSNTPNIIGQKVEQLQQQIDAAKIPIRIHCGAEIHIHPTLDETLRQQLAFTIGDTGKYALIEFPTLDIPRFASDLFYEMLLQNITPVIAHPERNAMIKRDPDLLIPWVEMGVLTQLTADSLLGNMGQQAKETAERLVHLKLTHVIASDAHRMDRRQPKLQAAYDTLGQIFSREMSQQFHQRASAILKGQPISIEAPMRKEKKRFFLF